MLRRTSFCRRSNQFFKVLLKISRNHKSSVLSRNTRYLPVFRIKSKRVNRSICMSYNRNQLEQEASVFHHTHFRYYTPLEVHY
eukprot:UN15622